MNLLSLLSSFACFAYISLGVYTLKLEPRASLNRLLFAIMMSASVWALSYSFIYAAPRVEDCFFWHRVSSLGWCLIPSLFLHFSFVFSGREKHAPRKWLLPVIYAPAAVFIARSFTGTITTEGFVRSPLGWTDLMVYNTPWYMLYMSVTGILMTAGVILVAHRGRSTVSRRERRQAQIITWSTTAALALIIVSEQALPYFRVYTLPVMGHLIMLIAALGIWYAIARHKLMTLDTAMAADQIIERIREFILLLDTGGRVIRSNRQADILLGYRGGKLLGMKFIDITKDTGQFAEKFSGILRGDYSAYKIELGFSARNGESIPVDTLFSVIRDASGEIIGILVVGHDLRETNLLLKEAREGEQRESEERFRTLVAHSSDIITIIDDDGTIRYASPSVEYILNYDPAEVTGKNPIEFIHPEEAAVMRKFFLVLRRNPGRIASRKVRLRSRDGDWRVFDVTFKNLVEDPVIHGIVVNFRDITERREYESQLREYRQNLEMMVHERTEELSRTNERLTREIAERREAEARLREQGRYLLALHSTALSIIDRLDITELLQSIVENASSLLNAPHGYIALSLPEENILSTRVGTGIFRRRIGTTFRRGEGLCGSVWESEQAAAITSYVEYPNRIPGPELDILKALVAAPLKTRGKVTGVIVLGRDREREPFEENEVQLLNRFAEIASLALDNAMLYDRLQQELDERRRAEESLWESNQKYRTILESIEDGYYEVDLKGTLSFMNSSLCRILGYPMDELVGLGYSRYMDEKNSREVFRAFNQVFIDGRPRKSFDWELIRKDGQHIIVEASVSLITDRQGNSTGFRGVLRDISERKKLEQSLKFLAHHDILTGLPNRILFADRLDQAIAHAGRNFSLMAVLFLDLDNFKDVNDGLGHDVGDLLLKETGMRLQESIREIDTVARFGGDEFIFILPDIKSADYAEKVVKRIHGAFEKPFVIKGHEITVSPSMGVAFYPVDSDNADTLLKKADLAQYRAKETGKNNFKFYSATMQK
jgi:diguanylate cyclase (GGDEF)-like protein/PAS domain S-box-containing protein